jgi:D-alanyl-D-alanine carboxypeptidase
MEIDVRPFQNEIASGFARTLFSCALLVSLWLGFSTNAQAQSRYASIVIDADTKEILDQRFANDPRFPASITKVMTLYLLFEALERGSIRMDEFMPISALAASQPPSKLGLNPGSSIRVDDAIRSQVLRSANDVSVVIAERLGGTTGNFALMMTRKARELGMASTTFMNPNGLPDSRQVTTAADLARLAIAIRRDFPDQYRWFSTTQMTWNGQVIGNHNRLLGRVPGVDGLKTGFTTASGYNLAATAGRDGRRLVVVVMGGSSGASRDAHTTDLMEAGFAELRRRSLMAVSMARPSGSFFSRDTGDLADAQALGADDASRIAIRGVIEQGDSEDAPPLTIQLQDPAEFGPSQPSRMMEINRRPASPNERVAPQTPTRASTTASRMDAAAKKPNTELAGGRPAAKPQAKFVRGNWSVQVGAFQKEEQANQHLALITRRSPPSLSGAKREVTTVQRDGQTWYRARFTGLAASSATDACKTLASRGINCMSIAGGGR